MKPSVACTFIAVGFESAHMPFPLGSTVVCGAVEEPLKSPKNIERTPEDDAFVGKWTRENADTNW